MLIIRKVLDFWFAGLKLSLTVAPMPIQPNSFSLWFGASSETDKLITETFSDDLKSVAADPKLQAELSETVEGAMALLIIFDQFTRNIFRNTPESFKYDPIALRTARLIREKNWDREMNPIYRGFAYLPFEHSEDINDQIISVSLFQELCDDVSNSSQPEIKTFYGQFTNQFLNYAISHRKIIEKFGRYPHRNEVLGRTSTQEEIEYLENGGETFGAAKK